MGGSCVAEDNIHSIISAENLAMMVDMPLPYLLIGAKRMVEALEWIHDKGYVHMDVKVCGFRGFSCSLLYDSI